MIDSALAVAAALLGIASALLFAIRAREAERATAALDDRLASALREAERLRALSRVEASDRARERDRLLRRAMSAEATAREWSDRASRAEAAKERARRDLAEADAELVRRWNLGDAEAARERVEQVRAAAKDYADVARLLVQLADAHPDEIVRGVPCETPHRARIVALAFLDVLRFHAPAELGRAIFSPVPPGIHPLPLSLAIINRERESAGMKRLCVEAAKEVAS